MSLDYKALKKLADACRKAGIKHFKNAEMEFTLSDEGPISNYKKRSAKSTIEETKSEKDSFASDTLTEQQLLMWSAIDSPDNEGTQ